MERIIKIVMLVLILVSGLAVAGCSSSPTPVPVQPSPAPTPVQPSPADNLAPDFQLQGIDEQTVSLSSLRGRPVMLNFWATWCGPCRAEMPFIQAVFEGEEWTQQGLVILAINVGETSSKAKKFMEDNGLSFHVLLDTDTSVAKDYNIRGIPTTFFIDKNGIIKDKQVGFFSSKADIDRRLVNSILDSE